LDGGNGSGGLVRRAGEARDVEGRAVALLTGMDAALGREADAAAAGLAPAERRRRRRGGVVLVHVRGPGGEGG
jgi:hypothetical protein